MYWVIHIPNGSINHISLFFRMCVRSIWRTDRLVGIFIWQSYCLALRISLRAPMLLDRNLFLKSRFSANVRRVSLISIGNILFIFWSDRAMAVTATIKVAKYVWTYTYVACTYSYYLPSVGIKIGRADEVNVRRDDGGLSDGEIRFFSAPTKREDWLLGKTPPPPAAATLLGIWFKSRHLFFACHTDRQRERERERNTYYSQSISLYFCKTFVLYLPNSPFFFFFFVSWYQMLRADWRLTDCLPVWLWSSAPLLYGCHHWQHQI